MLLVMVPQATNCIRNQVRDVVQVECHHSQVQGPVMAHQRRLLQPSSKHG